MDKLNIDGFVKRQISSFIWIPAFAGMTIKILISIRYNNRHTREGGYPGAKVTFYDFIKHSPMRKLIVVTGNKMLNTKKNCFIIYKK